MTPGPTLIAGAGTDSCGETERVAGSRILYRNVVALCDPDAVNGRTCLEAAGRGPTVATAGEHV
jgi:hypothetical protein